MKWLVHVRKERRQVLGLGATGVVNGEIVTSIEVVEGETQEHAVRHAAARQSVGDLKYGVEFNAVPLPEPVGAWTRAQYDGEPMTEGHGGTKAKLVYAHVPAR